jgi:imidazolonepropionase-like amidohydrolase
MMRKSFCLQTNKKFWGGLLWLWIFGLSILLLRASTIDPKPFDTAQESIVLLGGTLIDGNGEYPVWDAAVVIQGERIIYAGQRGGVAIPNQAQIISTAGMTILPGFINAHVHYTTEPERLRTWAYEGVTTVRDLGMTMEEFYWIKDYLFEHPEPTLARLLCSGPIVDVPGGRPHGSYGILITSPEDARDRTNYLLDAGVDLIKVYLEDGSIMNESWDVISLAELQAIVEVAHSRGVIVTAHVQEAYLVERALDGGVDDIAHSQLDELVPYRLIDRLISEDVYLVPTLEIYQVPYMRQMAMHNLNRLVERGVKIALGTDFDIQYGLELGMPSEEISLMFQSGMTPMQIIVAATKHGAHVCNLEDEIGTLEAGKIADILIVNGDPLVDLNVLKHDVMMVFHNGTLIRTVAKKGFSKR